MLVVAAIWRQPSKKVGRQWLEQPTPRGTLGGVTRG